MVVVADTTNATSTDRLRIYINGDRETSFNTANYPTLNANGTLNQANAHAVGATTTPGVNFDGYLAEVNFLDGTADDATSFGETKSGIWIPKQCTGSYGTNGFKLAFQTAAH